MSPDQVLDKVVTSVLSPLYQLAVGVAVVYFLYGVVKFIIDLNDPQSKNEGKSHLLWGTIGLFIILSVGGLLKFFNTLFDGVFVF